MKITFQTNFIRFRNFFKRFKKDFYVNRAEHYWEENEFFENESNPEPLYE